jgi:hypothetical protein
MATTSQDYAEIFLEDERQVARLGCQTKAERRAAAAKRKRKLQSKEVELLKTGKGFACRDEEE